MEEPKVIISNSAVSCVEAVLSGKDFSAERKAFYDLVNKCVLKPDGHKMVVETKHLDATASRLYAITTWAPTPATGGQRTVAICDRFEQARDIVEMNLGDIYECSYILAVIEMIPANYLYWTGTPENYWYMWTQDPNPPAHGYDGSYKAIEVPPGMEDKTLHPIG
jgi:hypothetical protein